VQQQQQQQLVLIKQMGGTPLHIKVRNLSGLLQQLHVSGVVYLP
jgi:hypothetical protein